MSTAPQELLPPADPFSVEPRQPRAGVRTVLAVMLLTVYSGLFIARPPAILPAEVRSAWRAPASVVRDGLHVSLRFLGFADLNRDVRNVAYLVLVSGVIPLAAVLLTRRSLRDVGTRLPNRYGPRLVLIAVVIAFPFLVWMVNSPDIAKPYVDEWNRNTPAVFLSCYFCNMLTEHFLIQGVILGLCHTSGRWPRMENEAVADSNKNRRWRSALRWLGLDQPVERSRRVHPVAQWFGLPSGCLAAILTSALVFGLIHVGKDFRECLLSFPGGLAIAYIAFRTDSWLTPFMIHASTAGLAFLMMYAGFV